jgi:ankyrin repeat protein
LIAACQTRGNVKIVELLLKYGASVNKMGTEGQTALLYAARNGDAPTMALLLRAGADVALADKEIGESLKLLNYKIQLPVGAL